MSKELENIIIAIQKYCKKHKGEVQFTGSFMAFEGKECKVVDDRMFAFGDKETLIMDLQEMLKQIKKEKEDFISW